ncbi:MAG TPA: hypothetical protein VF753_10650 [Terriglobales bacterium]
MKKRSLLVLAVVATAGLASAREDAWLQATSPHFTVITNGNERQARHVAGQFERMRTVFHARFPEVEIDPVAPIVVIAVRDQSDMRAIEPEAYLAKGSLELGGLFLRAPDKNYVLMRLDATGDYPFQIIYHEYTHLILGKGGEWLPLWLNEGTAQFYETTVIHDKDVVMGDPLPQARDVLRHDRSLPLQTLLAVDHNSPYYHREDKGSIFYAESWALTHYLINMDWQQHTHRISDYLDLVMQKVDSVTAATRAFGDLNQLQKRLTEYIGQPALYHFTMPIANGIDEATFKVQPLPRAAGGRVSRGFSGLQRTREGCAGIARSGDERCSE